jgi:hypothetical protein
MADTATDHLSADNSQSVVTQAQPEPTVREDWAAGHSVAWQCLMLFIFSAIWMIALMFIIMGLTAGPIAATWSDYVNAWGTFWYIPVAVVLLATISPIIRDRWLKRRGR